MKLPDWARYCAGCGARVHRAASADDPLESTDVDDTAVEPLWDSDSEWAEEDVPAYATDDSHADELTIPMAPPVAEPLRGATERMEYTSSDDETADSDERIVDVEDEAANERAATSDESAELVVASDKESEGDGADEKSAAVGEGSGVLAPEKRAADADGDTDDFSEERVREDAAHEDADAASILEQADDGAGQEVVSDAASETDSSREDARQSDLDAQSEDEARDGSSRAHDWHVSVEGTDRETMGEWQPRGTIDVGEDDGVRPDEGAEQLYTVDPWELRRRPSERRVEQASGPSISQMVAVVLGALLVGSLLVSGILSMNGGGGSLVSSSGRIWNASAKEQATQTIAGLNGWWKTDRTYDGRYWHIQDGLMEIYAADGQLASEKLIDPSLVEHMDSGPGGIEGPGFYLRDIAFYLCDDDSDTLHAVDSDGTANEDANLFRTEAPAFMSGTGRTQTENPNGTTPVLSDDYILPESATRAYESWELEDLSDHDLFLARNEIYARHGYVFDSGELSEYFMSKSWYWPAEVFNEGDISEVERQNVSTILSVEQARGSQYV